MSRMIVTEHTDQGRRDMRRDAAQTMHDLMVAKNVGAENVCAASIMATLQVHQEMGMGMRTTIDAVEDLVFAYRMVMVASPVRRN